MSQDGSELDLIIDCISQDKNDSCESADETNMKLPPLHKTKINLRKLIKRRFNTISKGLPIPLYSDAKKICTYREIKNICYKTDTSETPGRISPIIEESNSMIENYISSSNDSVSTIKENLEKEFGCPLSPHGTNSFKDAKGNMYQILKVGTDSTSQTEKCPILSIDLIKEDNKAVEFYTGLQNYEKFLNVFKTLEQDVGNLEYYYNDDRVYLTHLDQFFMTLILFKHQKSHVELSILFKITLRDIKNVFITWVKFMSLKWTNLGVPKAVDESGCSKTKKKRVVKNCSPIQQIINEIDEILEDDYETNPSNTDRSHYKKSK